MTGTRGVKLKSKKAQEGKKNGFPFWKSLTEQSKHQNSHPSSLDQDNTRNNFTEAGFLTFMQVKEDNLLIIFHALPSKST